MGLSDSKAGLAHGGKIGRPWYIEVRLAFHEDGGQNAMALKYVCDQFGCVIERAWHIPEMMGRIYNG